MNTYFEPLHILIRPSDACYGTEIPQISYSTARDDVSNTIQRIGLDSRQYDLHSLRVDGATVAANLGAEDRLFKVYGRWKSDTAKDGYILFHHTWDINFLIQIIPLRLEHHH